MRVLVFDTETTGLPTERNASIYHVDKWPYIIQLSYIIYCTGNPQVWNQRYYFALRLVVINMRYIYLYRLEL